MYSQRPQPLQFSWLAILFCVLFAINLLGGMAHAETADVVNEARQEELKHLLRHDCGSCHGMTLKGGLGPALSKQRLADKPDDFITYTILYGRTGTAMPPWQGILSEADARWLATYIKANGPEKGDQ